MPFEESFLLVGGYSGIAGGHVMLDTIYKYQKGNDSWSLLETKMPSPARDPVAMMVDVDIFPSC